MATKHNIANIYTHSLFYRCTPQFTYSEHKKPVFFATFMDSVKQMVSCDGSIHVSFFLFYSCYSTALLMLFYCSTHDIILLYSCYSTALLMLFYCSTHDIILLYLCYSTALLVLFYCSTHVILLLYSCYSTALLMLFYCSTRPTSLFTGVGYHDRCTVISV